MKEKEFYCLRLNNCPDTQIHYIALKEFSVIKDAIQKEYQTIEKEIINNDFIELDDTIISKENGYLVKGAIPVLAMPTGKNNEMKDVLTGKIINYSDSSFTKGLTYSEKHLASIPMSRLILNILNKEDLNRYIEGLNKIAANSNKQEEIKYYKLILTNSDDFISYSREYHGEMQDILTEKTIYNKEDKTITSDLSYIEKNEITKEEVLSFLNNLDHENIEKYMNELTKIEKETIRLYNNSINMGKVLVRRKIGK